MCIRVTRPGAWTVPSLLVALLLVGSSSGVLADPVTFSGTVSYDGLHAGDSLYVAVLDTAGVEDVTILDIQVIAADAPPFDHGYSLDFDNAAVSAGLFVAGFLDVDGGGVDDIGGADVFGWFGEEGGPAMISSASSQAGLDFSLPLAEIHGTVIFAPGQAEARFDVSSDLACLEEGFRPGTHVMAAGAYAIVGLYEGSYCVSAEGNTMSGFVRVCFGDPTCASPTVVTLTETEIRMGVDLDFTKAAPVAERTWGGVKGRYR